MEHFLLLRIAAIYHGLVGATLLLLPGAVHQSLGLDMTLPALPYFVTAVVPIGASGLLLWSLRNERLRPGLVASVVVGNIMAGLVVVLAVAAEGLPWTLYGPGVAASLWAYLLWDVVSPEEG